jgi:hypothetical protein
MELGLSVEFLVSDKFMERDKNGIWRTELAGIAADLDTSISVYESEFTAYRSLQGKNGVLIAASESNLSAHAHTHNVFRVAPTSFLKITLQHGFECVGFLQNREHNIAHGRNVAFAADVVCGWCDPSILRSLAPSERPKLYVTGPSALAATPAAQKTVKVGTGGLVCENLHSVRLNISGDFKAPFMDTFFAFCERLKAEGQSVTLRPHPGGQYVLKNNIVLPENVSLNNRPMYDVDLSQYDFGISAPSSVVLDMVLAGIPAAVWTDEDGVMDASNYDGLTMISTLDDWLAFRRDAAVQPDMLLSRQAAFLERIKMPTDPQDVRERFTRLLTGGAQRIGEIRAKRPRNSRILFVANGFLPTLQLSFVKPLATWTGDSEVTWQLLSEEQLRTEFGDQASGKAAAAAVLDRLEDFDPGLIVLCRYSGPHSPLIIDWARKRGTPTVYHIDDDLLNVPKEIGLRKYKAHNAPPRLASVRHSLSEADLVYCSTTPLLRQFRAQGFERPMIAGEIYCAGEVLRPATDRPVLKLGYMGFDHAHDLELVLPALIEVLRCNPHIQFELFGSIPKPEALDEFGDRVTVIEPERIYEKFLAKFAALDWDIGICPLAETRFNAVKANTKWVEYTAVGAAVVATRGMTYDHCCADGCGDLATTREEWVAALNDLCTNSKLRYERVAAAQARLDREYSLTRLGDQLRSVFRRAAELASEPVQ